MDEPALRAVEVSKTYEDEDLVTTAVDHVDLAVEAGDFVVLVTHDVKIASAAERLAVMRDGRLKEQVVASPPRTWSR